ncbi:alpha/beta hydrolase [Serpentinicella alkaliphila]|nr:alpha/beta hydrolase [Serpentinicella alkaliphila]
MNRFSIKSFRRGIGRVMFIVLSILLVSTFIFAGVLLAWSPGKPIPFIDENGRPLVGSISEKIHVNINGVEQGMFIKGRDKAKPVLLFLHGGPGLPTYWLTSKYPTGLEDYFTVCYWETRGTGLSYNSEVPPKTVTWEQLISDTIEVSNYLRKRFGQEKIYLMGHSGGSFLGIQVAARAPELYNAYIGVAQMSRQFESEKLAYKYMIEQYTKARDIRMVQKLEKFPIPEMNAVPKAYRNLRDVAMHRLGIGTMHNMKSVITGVFFTSFQSREYTLSEKINLWRGKNSSQYQKMWDEMMETDLTKIVQKLNIPVYFFEGVHDYTCNYTLTKEYFEKLQAPVKGFYTFINSAHSPIFEEPEKVKQILEKDVLSGKNNLADIK